MNKKNILLLIIFLSIDVIIMAQDIPVPSAYFNFNQNWFIDDNKTDKETATTIPDNSFNDLNAIWYNFNSEFPSTTSGFKADSGKFGGAAYFGGYNSMCGDENAPSAAADVIFFAGNDNPDGWDAIDSSYIWQGVRQKMTVTYWWKSDREFSGTVSNACPPDEKPGWEMMETHFQGGSFNGLILKAYYNYFRIGWRNGSDGVDDVHQSGWFALDKDENAPALGDWVHVALVFDGTKVDAEGNPAGEITLYLNGELAYDIDDGPNPIVTTYKQLDAHTFGVGRAGACTFGGTNGPSPDGLGVSGFWGTGDGPALSDKPYYIEDHYRTGWPARGYLDEFAYWKDECLTQEQIKTVMNNQIADLIVRDPNVLPVANAGEDIKVRDSENDNEIVLLDGSKSTDSDGEIVSYKWIAGDTTLAIGETSSVELPVGEHVIVLQVTDNRGGYDKDTVIVTIYSSMLPIANAGEDIFAVDKDGDGKAIITLDGSLSKDIDGEIVKYEWQENGVFLAEKMNADVVLTTGEHYIVLSVIDNAGEEATDTVLVTVYESNPPIAKAGDDIFVVDEDGDGKVVVTLSGINSVDEDGGIIKYEWYSEGILLAEKVVSDVVFKIGEYEVVLKVTDNTEISSTDTVNVKVIEATSIQNSLPDYIHIYPNPTKGEVYIVLDEAKEKAVVSVVNSIGVTVKSFSINSCESVIDMSDLQNGVYIIKIENNNNTYIEKLQLIK